MEIIVLFFFIAYMFKAGRELFGVIVALVIINALICCFR